MRDRTSGRRNLSLRQSLMTDDQTMTQITNRQSVLRALSGLRDILHLRHMRVKRVTGGFRVKMAVSLSLILISGALASAQVYTDTLSIYFPKGSATLDKDFAYNGERADIFIKKARRVIEGKDGKAERIRFEVSCSPEGNPEVNDRLLQERTKNVRAWIEEELDTEGMASEIHYEERHWIELYNYVNSVFGMGMPDRQRCLEVLAKAEREKLESKEVSTLMGSDAWEYLTETYFPELRRFRIILFIGVQMPELEIDDTDLNREITDNVHEQFNTLSDSLEMVETIPYSEPASLRRRPVFVKTNAVGLAMLVGNVAAEFALSDRFSLNIPVYYSGMDWFGIETKFRTLAFQPELRYNFGVKGGDSYAVGLYLGAHAGLAWYNFAFGGDWRYQDHDGRNPAYGGGLSLGYRMPLGRRVPGLGLEFNLGAGVYSLNYDKFYNEADGPQSETGIREVKLLPDAVGISLYYRFDRSRRSGGRSSR